MDSSIVAQILPSRTVAPQPKGRLLYGAGLNDVSHTTSANGKMLKTYNVWHNMLRRCYSAHCQATKPTYRGCSVSSEWLRFSVFEEWMLTQDYEGKSLDKDLLFPGNKLYSAVACVFVPQTLNSLLTSGNHCRGAWPLGVSYFKNTGKYAASITKEGLQHHLGLYDTPLEAHRAWQLAKADIIEAFPTDDIRVRLALDKRATQLREDAANGRITETL